MNFFRLLIVVVLLLTSSKGLAEGIPRGALLDGILYEESRGDHSAVGELGERGGYQFRRSTWCDRTSSPFSLAHNPEVARTVAEWHYDWIKATLMAEGVGRPTDWQIAAAWNCGASAVSSGRIPRRSRSYAERVLAAARRSLAETVVADEIPSAPMFIIKIPSTTSRDLAQIAKNNNDQSPPLFSISADNRPHQWQVHFNFQAVGMLHVASR